MSRYVGQADEFSLQSKEHFSRRDDEAEDSLSSSDSSIVNDRIRRHQRESASVTLDINHDSNRGNERDTIHVRLNESYFAKEQTAIYNFLANTRQYLTSLRLFNPAKNENIRQKEETWTESVSFSRLVYKCLSLTVYISLLSLPLLIS